MFCLSHDVPQTALQTDAPGCRLKTNVTTSSMEKKTRSKATLLREQKPSARDLVLETFLFSNILSKTNILYSQCVCVCVSLLSHIAVLFLELLAIQSGEENDFVIKYSPEVWKGIVNVWLGMYYDTNSKYRVTGGL